MKSNRFVVVVLVVAVVALTGFNIYQNYVIHKQSFEIRWMMSHGTFTFDVPAKAAAATPGKAAAAPAIPSDKAPAPKPGTATR